jgi:hypothetical protein
MHKPYSKTLGKCTVVEAVSLAHLGFNPAAPLPNFDHPPPYLEYAPIMQELDLHAVFMQSM